MKFPAELAALAAAALLFPAAAAADPACDPQVADAIAAAAKRGVERDAAIVRHPAQGIRNPESILDFTCAGDLFDYRRFHVFHDPGRPLGLLRRKVCDAARRAYGRYLGRTLDPGVYAAPRLPGLRPAPADAPAPRPPPGSGDRFRSLIGGGR